MQTLPEIQQAASQLSTAEKQQLLLSLAQSLRELGQPTPAPRDFSIEEMHSWMDEDERDMNDLRAGK